MADIEDRAEKAWAAHHQDLDNHHSGSCEDARQLFIAGYMAGVAQTQHDYVAHYSARGQLTR